MKMTPSERNHVSKKIYAEKKETAGLLNNFNKKVNRRKSLIPEESKGSFANLDNMLKSLETID